MLTAATALCFVVACALCAYWGYQFARIRRVGGAHELRSAAHLIEKHIIPALPSNQMTAQRTWLQAIEALRRRATMVERTPMRTLFAEHFRAARGGKLGSSSWNLPKRSPAPSSACFCCG